MADKLATIAKGTQRASIITSGTTASDTVIFVFNDATESVSQLIDNIERTKLSILEHYSKL